MVGILNAGEGAALASLLTYFILILLPIVMAVFGIISLRKKTPDGVRIGKGMLAVAGLMLVVIIGFFVITAL